MDTKRKILPISCEVINGIFVILDLRYQPPKYIGLIKPKPFDRGYHFCPSVKSTIQFKVLSDKGKRGVPSKWRTADRAWDWVERYAVSLKPSRKYTVFNPMIRWVAYMPQLFYLIRDFQLQLIFIKVVIGAFFGLYMHSTENKVLDIISIGFIVMIGLTVITDLGLFIHKWRSRS